MALLFLSEDEVDYQVTEPFRCNKCHQPTLFQDLATDRRLSLGKKKTCKSCVRQAGRVYGTTERGRFKHAERERNRRRDRPEQAMYDLAKQRAKKRGLDFDLTVEDIVIPDCCPVLGIPLITGLPKVNDNSPTLDRVDNTLGYTRDNVVVISWRANRLKGTANAEELRKILRYMDEWKP